MNAKAVGTCVLAAIAFTAFVGAAHAQNFPIGPIPVIMPWVARDATDILLRPIAISDKNRRVDSNQGRAADSTLGTLTFRDEFQSFQIWNGQHGWDVTGGPQWSALGRVVPQGTEPFNNELGWYLDPSYQPATVNPFSVNDSVLSINATPYPQTTYFDLFPYTTGIITSYHSLSQLYGYFEMRAKLPRGKGFLPAFWLLPADGTHAEIDAMEVLGNDPTQLYTTVHSYSTGSLVSTGKTTTIPDASESFHIYGVDWQSNYITWYFDGQQVFQANTPTDLHTPMYMIANIAVGGTWPGDPALGSAAEMKIDYILVTTGGPPPSQLQVTPATNIAVSGPAGGPFSPSSFQYQLSAPYGDMNYSISGIPSWLNASFTSGTATTSPVTDSFSLMNAGSLAPGTYNATISFTNTSNGSGNTTRTATLTVTAAVPEEACATIPNPLPSASPDSGAQAALVSDLCAKPRSP